MNRFLPLSILMLSSGVASAQLGIGTNAPNQSAVLDLTSTSKGFLIPRMTEAQRLAIGNPPFGLLVFQTDNTATSTAGLYANNSNTPATPSWAKTGSGAQNINGGAVDNTPIGDNGRSTGKFTTLDASVSTTTADLTASGSTKLAVANTNSTQTDLVTRDASNGGLLETRPVSSLSIAATQVGNGLTDAQVNDNITVSGAGSSVLNSTITNSPISGADGSFTTLSAGSTTGLSGTTTISGATILSNASIRVTGAIPSTGASVLLGRDGSNNLVTSPIPTPLTASNGVKITSNDIQLGGATTGTGATITTSGTSPFTINGNGLDVANGLRIASGGATITAGGLTVSAGGAQVSGNSTITGNATVTGTDVTLSGALSGAGIDLVTIQNDGKLGRTTATATAAALAGNGLTPNGGKIDLGGTLGSTGAIIVASASSPLTINAGGASGLRISNLPTSTGTSVLTRSSSNSAIQTDEIVSVINNSAAANTIAAARIANGLTDAQVGDDLTITSTKSGSFIPAAANAVALTVTGNGTGVGLIANNGAQVNGKTTTTDLTVNNSSSPVAIGAGGIGSTSGDLNIVQNNTRGGRITTSNLFMGNTSGPATNQGGANTGFGTGVMQNLNSSASNNTAIGLNAMRSTTTGTDNTSAGAGTFDLNQSGSRNTAFGRDAMYSNILGNQNTAPGNQSLFKSTGDNNVGLGYQSGYDLASGSGNTFLGAGSQAGSVNTSPVVASPTGLSNATAIGFKAQVNAGNSVVIGSVNGVNGATSNVNVGIGVNSPTNALHVKPAGTNDPVLIEGLNQDNTLINLLVSNAGVVKTRTVASLNIPAAVVVDGTTITGAGTSASPYKVGAVGDNEVANDLTIASTKAGSFTNSAGSALAITGDGTSGAAATVTNTGNGYALKVNGGATGSGINISTTGGASAIISTGNVQLSGLSGSGNYIRLDGSSNLVRTSDASLANLSAAGAVGLNTTGTGVTIIGNNSGPSVTNLNSTTINASNIPSGTAAVVIGRDGSGNLVTTTGASGWSLTGNTGTNPATNFLGTTDAQPLVLGVNNTRSGYIGTGTADLTAFGNGAGNINTSTGTNNTAVGSSALYSNTNGYLNTAVGSQALQSNKGGNSNTGVGPSALYSNVTGSDNTALGSSALNLNTASGNTAVGSGAADQTTTASGLTAVGYNALGGANTGRDNTAVGNVAMSANTSGDQNTAVGSYALQSNQGGYYNTALGYAAAVANVSGNNNTAIGNFALNGNGGNNNTAVGQNSLRNGPGTGNTAIGVGAGTDVLGSVNPGTNNTFLGASAVPTVINLSNSTAIGYQAAVGADNSMVLGSISGVNSAAANTSVGIGITAPKSRLHVKGSFGTAIRVVKAASPPALDDNDQTVVIDYTGGVIALTGPAAGGTNTGRIYTIINRTAQAHTTIAYLPLSGGAVTTTAIPIHTTIVLQSDGSDWYQID